MIEEFSLHKLIRQAIEKQIHDNDPPATKEAYDRLINNGYDENSALEKIISAIAEEIYDVLSKEKILDEKTYSKKLSKLI